MRDARLASCESWFVAEESQTRPVEPSASLSYNDPCRVQLSEGAVRSTAPFHLACGHARLSFGCRCRVGRINVAVLVVATMPRVIRLFVQTHSRSGLACTHFAHKHLADLQQKLLSP